MSKSKYDWATLQEFYDLGHSWREVREKFGIHNASITRAVKRGDLQSRDRGQSISLSLGGTGIIANSPCVNCGKIVRHKPGINTGRFCNPTCFGENSKKENRARIEAGRGKSNSVREYLLERDKVCSKCEQGDTWQGEPLSLHMDHIDGDSDNNKLDNVRLLCPNCHSQTPNFGIKNKGQRSRRNRYMWDQRNRKRDHTCELMDITPLDM